jgi:hypothetical protein
VSDFASNSLAIIRVEPGDPILDLGPGIVKPEHGGRSAGRRYNAALGGDFPRAHSSRFERQVEPFLAEGWGILRALALKFGDALSKLLDLSLEGELAPMWRGHMDLRAQGLNIQFYTCGRRPSCSCLVFTQPGLPAVHAARALSHDNSQPATFPGHLPAPPRSDTRPPKEDPP